MEQYSFSLDYAGTTTQVNKHWQFCVGSGHAVLAHRTDYAQQLKVIHDELGIERVRFHGVFNDDMHVCERLRHHLPTKFWNKSKIYNFYQVGKIYDNILEAGMKPFVELSFMPSALASGKKTVFYYKGNITPPKDREEWKGFIRSFVRFLIDRYGIDEIRTWYFEVWNEPDLSCFFHGNMNDYYQLYADTVQAIKSVDEKIPVGGPATTHSAHLDEFLSFCKQNYAPVDFVSTHQYPTDALGHDMSKEKTKKLKALKTQAASASMSHVLQPIFDDSNRLEGASNTYLSQCAQTAKEQVGALPLYYTEWSISSNCVAAVHDTLKSASFLVKTVMDWQGIVDGSSYWTFSDIFEELYPFPEPFHGGFGLLTVDSIKKPAFWALKLLSQLPNTRYTLPITNEAVEFTAFKEENGALHILLYAQSFNESEQTFSVNFSIENVPNFKTVSTQRINRHSGNPLVLWEAMGKPTSLTPKEVEELKAKSQPSFEQTAVVTTDNTTHLSVDLSENETLLIILQP